MKRLLLCKAYIKLFFDYGTIVRFSSSDKYK